MILKPKQMLTGLLLSLFLPQLAFATGDSNSGSTNNTKHHVIPAQMEEGDNYVTVSLFSNENCLKDDGEPKGGAAGLIIDIGLALVGALLENQKDNLRATYAGSTTSVINSLKCIKVERKEKVLQSNDKTLMVLELLVDKIESSNNASRLLVQKLEVRDPAPSKSKVKASTRLNYAISVGFSLVDEAGKERSFTRNLPLIEDVPLTGTFGKSEQVSTVTLASEKDRKIASSVFSNLPNAMTSTVTVSITETDSKYSKAEKVSDFFDDNKSILDTALGEIFD